MYRKSLNKITSGNNIDFLFFFIFSNSIQELIFLNFNNINILKNILLISKFLKKYFLNFRYMSNTDSFEKFFIFVYLCSNNSFFNVENNFNIESEVSSVNSTLSDLCNSNFFKLFNIMNFINISDMNSVFFLYKDFLQRPRYIRNKVFKKSTNRLRRKATPKSRKFLLDIFGKKPIFKPHFFSKIEKFDILLKNSKFVQDENLSESIFIYYKSRRYLEDKRSFYVNKVMIRSRLWKISNLFSLCGLLGKNIKIFKYDDQQEIVNLLNFYFLAHSSKMNLYVFFSDKVVLDKFFFKDFPATISVSKYFGEDLFTYWLPLVSESSRDFFVFLMILYEHFAIGQKMHMSFLKSSYYLMRLEIFLKKKYLN